MRRWQFWLGVLISVVFIWLALRGLQFQQFWTAVQTADYWWLLPGIALYFIAVWVRAWRWHYLLRPVKKIPTQKMFPIVAIGYMGNNIYPARAGEVLRAVILKRKEDVSISASLATIIVERIFDGVVMLGFVFVNLPELANLTGQSGFVGNIQQVAIIGTGVFLGALLIFLLAAMFPFQTEKISTALIKKFVPEKVISPGKWYSFLKYLILRLIFRGGGKRIEFFLDDKVDRIELRSLLLGLTLKFLKGLESLRSPWNSLMIFFTSVIIWLLETGKYWFVMHAFNFHVSFFALMLMNGIVNLATTIPSAPGYIGTFDAPGIAVLMAYGVDQATAAGYTIVLHIALWLPITLLGAYFLTREGIQWSDTLRAEAEINT